MLPYAMPHTLRLLKQCIINIQLIATAVTSTIALNVQAPTEEIRPSREMINGVAVGATILVFFVFLGVLTCGYLRWYLKKKAKRRLKKESQYIVDQFVAE